MSIVKKWANCVIAFVAGVLGLAMSATTGMKVLTTIGATGATNNKIVKAFKVLTDSSLLDEAKRYGVENDFICMKVFAIITLIAAILLIVWSIVMLLQNLNVIKSSHIAFDIVTIALVVLFLVATIGLLVSSNAYGNAITGAIEAAYPAAYQVSSTAKLGVYQPFMLVVSIITAIVTGTFTFLNKKRG